MQSQHDITTGFFLFTLYLHCMLHYKWVILHALLLHISTLLYLSIYSVFTYYPILVCLGWLLITLFFIQYYIDQCLKRGCFPKRWKMYVCLYVCVYACMYVCKYVCMHVCMHMCMYVCLYLYMHACMYVCMHVCVCVFVYICFIYIYIYVLYVYIYMFHRVPDTRYYQHTHHLQHTYETLIISYSDSRHAAVQLDTS